MKSWIPVGGRAAVVGLVGFAFLSGELGLADVLYLKNGDRLSGHLVEVENGDLFFDPDMTDEVKIGVGDIESLETTATIRVELEDGTERTGFLVRDPDGSMWLRPGAGGEVIDEPLSATDEDRLGGLIELSRVHHIEEAQTYFNYTANIDVGLSGATGNSDQSSFNLSVGFAPRFGKNRFSIKGQVNQAENDGETSASNWRIDNRYERDLTQKWFAGGLLDLENDDLQNLNLRTSLAPVVGYRFFEGSPTDLNVLVGPAFVNENFSGSDDDRNYLAALWRLNFLQDLYTSDVQFYHNHKITVGISDSGVIVLTTTGLKFDLIADLDLLLEAQYDWNSNPADGAKQSDLRYLVKLRYVFEGDQNNWFD